MSNKWKKRDNPWAYVKRKYRLNARQIAMAKELGIRPKKFGSMAPNKSEQRKGPLGEFIEECYYKRFKDREPEIFKPDENNKSKKRFFHKKSSKNCPSGGAGDILFRK